MKQAPQNRQDKSYGVKGGSSSFNNAKLHSIPLSLIESAVVSPGDTLRIKLYVRNAAVGSGKNSGTARLWFNDAQANSSFGATIGDTPTDFHLLDGFTLGAAPGPSTGGKRSTLQREQKDLHSSCLANGALLCHRNHITETEFPLSFSSSFLVVS